MDHLWPADLITSINECKIQNQEDWVRCLTQGGGTQRNASDPNSFTATQLLELMAQPVSKSGEHRRPRPCKLLSRKQKDPPAFACYSQQSNFLGCQVSVCLLGHDR